MDKTINELLVEVQQELKAPKGQTNKFGGYKFRSTEDIVEAVKPLIHSRGLHLTISDNIVNLSDRFYIVAYAVITNKTGEQISATGIAREELEQKGMATAQITGSTSSYARKYALNGLFAIDDTKDDDANNTHDKEPVRPTANPTPVTKVTPTVVNKKDDSKPVTSNTVQAKDVKAPVTLTDGKGAIQPNTNFDKPDEEATRRAKALELYKKLDPAVVLKTTIKAQFKYTSVDEFVNKAPIDKVLEIYGQLTAK